MLTEIKKFRQIKGWTQQELGVKSDLNTATINRLENDPDADPQISTLRRVADALGVEVVDIVKKEEAAPPYITMSHYLLDRFNRLMEEFCPLGSEEELKTRWGHFFAMAQGETEKGKVVANQMWIDRQMFMRQ